MKILSTLVVRETKTFEVEVQYKGKIIKFSVSATDGFVYGDYTNNIATSYLDYFHKTPDDIQAKNFKIIKKNVESAYND